MLESSHPYKLVRLWYTLGAILLLAVMVVSLIPMPDDVSVSDKTGHLFVYLVLSGWFSLLARDRGILGLSLLGLVLYGMLIELLQGLTGYRSAEWGDVIANTLGCALGTLGYLPPLRRFFGAVDARLAR